ncbi:ATP-grasp domain-containing protein [Pendulispora brunnea]|uniref:ATP-grasp domain-containing protein n=1 Tax=Pendulispora brunnea TaxID=2905690 RepID=A0ABZ2KL10_9BACT
MRHFTFIESNTTGTGRLAVRQILERGDALTFVTRQSDKYPFLREPHARLRVLDVETNDLDATHAAVEKVHRREPIDALLTFSTFYVPLVARVASRLGLSYLNPEAATLCHEKHAMRERMRQTGLPHPEFWLLASEIEAETLAPSLPYPVIVKPTAESSSNGVVRVENAQALLEHYRTLSARKENERGQRVDGLVLVEGLIQGPEFSVETFTFPDRGTGRRTTVVGITEKHLSPPPFFVEMGHDFPAAIDAEARASLEEATLAALDAVGFDFGPAHTELRLSAQGPVVIEINPRLAGGMIPELVRLATGIDLLNAVLELPFGLTDLPAASRNDVASIRFITSRESGTLASVRGLDRAREFDTVCEVAVEKKTGAPVRPATSALDRLGYVIGRGGQRARVVAEVEEALRGIELDLGPR